MTTVTINDAYKTVVITEGNGDTAIVTAPSPAVTVETIGIGPQGPQGPAGAGINNLYQLNDVDVAGKVEGSILVYDTTTSKFVAGDITTRITLTDGGNF
jgi:hypothetical protein